MLHISTGGGFCKKCGRNVFTINGLCTRCGFRVRGGCLSIIGGMIMIVIWLVIFLPNTKESQQIRSFFQFSGTPSNNTQKVKVELDELVVLLERYKSNFGSYPSDKEGLETLCSCPPSADPLKWVKIAKWNSPPLDPWGNTYHYNQYLWHDGTRFKLWSSGPDGISGTSDDIYYGR